MNVIHHFLVVLRVADIAIPILAHPELICRGYLKGEPLVLTQYPAGGEGLPTLNEDRKIRQGFDKDMNVVWHDTPRVEVVAITMEV